MDCLERQAWHLFTKHFHERTRIETHPLILVSNVTIDVVRCYDKFVSFDRVMLKVHFLQIVQIFSHFLCSGLIEDLSQQNLGEDPLQKGLTKKSLLFTSKLGKDNQNKHGLHQKFVALFRFLFMYLFIFLKNLLPLGLFLALPAPFSQTVTPVTLSMPTN